MGLGLALNTHLAHNSRKKATHLPRWANHGFQANVLSSNNRKPVKAGLCNPQTLPKVGLQSVGGASGPGPDATGPGPGPDGTGPGPPEAAPDATRPGPSMGASGLILVTIEDNRGPLKANSVK